MLNSYKTNVKFGDKRIHPSDLGFINTGKLPFIVDIRESSGMIIYKYFQVISEI